MYNAIVCKIKTFPHPDADKIQLGNANGFQVVVGLDVTDGQLGVFFPTDGQLSEEMCKANNLISYTDPTTGEKRGGYFSSKRRVRSQKFRGEQSEGYWTELEALKFTGFDLSKLKEGDQFTELNKIPVCNKYFTPKTLKAMRNKNGLLRKTNVAFHKHSDTKQLKYEITKIPAGSLLYFTEKVHGTSARTGLVYDTVQKKNWYSFIPGLAKTRELGSYEYLTGTRNTILNKSDTPGFYGNEGFRIKCSDIFKGFLHKDEIVYYEIVGYTATGQSIMPSVDTSCIKDKEFTRLFGKQMTYKYGQVQGQCDIYVYRITRSNRDGNAIDLSWNQVKRRCIELGVKHVPELSKGIIYDGNCERLLSYVESFLEKPSIIDNSHLAEGVVLRIENDRGTDFLKHKSFHFGMLEGYIKDTDDYVDMEEIS